MTEVEIHHPKRGRTVRVPAEMYPGRLAAKGWELVNDPGDRRPPVTEDDLNAQLDEKDQLRQVLTDRGVTGWDGRTGVKKLRQLAEGSE